MHIQTAVRHEDTRPLVLFFLGYAFTPESVAHLSASPYDLSVVYDYRDLDFDKSFLAGRKIFLIAHSMGVWAANRVLKDIPLEQAIAVNGTPFGIHERFGISPQAFKNSIEHFDFELFKKWCFLSDASKVNFRFADNPKDELCTLYEASAEPVEQNVAWTKAIVSKKDLVFPPKASECFKCPVKNISAPHYPFFKFRSVEEILAF